MNQKMFMFYTNFQLFQVAAPAWPWKLMQYDKGDNRP